MTKMATTDEKITLDMDIFIGVCNVLIKKYGDFKLTDVLYNQIIVEIGKICKLIEIQNELEKHKSKETK